MLLISSFYFIWLIYFSLKQKTGPKPHYQLVKIKKKCFQPITEKKTENNKKKNNKNIFLANIK